MSYAQPITPVAQPRRTREEAAVSRAVARAVEMAGRGIRPLLVSREDSRDGCQTYQTWVVGSRTTDGRLYEVELLADLGGLEARCACEAAHVGRRCWHAQAVTLAALGQLPRANTLPVEPPGPDLDDVTAWAAVESPIAFPVAWVPAPLPTIGGKRVDQSALTGRRRSA